MKRSKTLDHNNCKILHVSRWDNGMIVCFCIHERVMRMYTGDEQEVIPKLRAVYRGVIHKAFWLDVPEGKQLNYAPMLD